MTETNYKVGIYLRLSREDERFGESGSISTQRDLLLNYIKDNNLIFIDEYVDDGVSGTTFDRVGFNRMIKDCEAKKINMIITKDTSRLGRDHIEFGFYVERYFPEHGIRYVAVNDGIDTSKNSSANDMLIFKSAFNDMYVKDISNKLKSSLYTKKRNGLFVGCYAPYGYKKSEENKHKLEIEEKEAIVVKRIYNLFVEGQSLTNICNILTKENIPTPSMSKNMKLGQNNLHYGVWSERTVNSILKNPTYIGNLTQSRQKKVNYKSKKRVHNNISDWIIAEGASPQIIDKETFDLVQNMFKTNKYRGSKNNVTNNLLLKGLIYCKECKHTIGFRESKQHTKKYGLVSRIYGNCNYWAKRKKQDVCTPHSIKYQDIEEIVLSNLREMAIKYLDEKILESILKNSNKLKQKKDSIKQEIFRLENSIELLTRKIDVCYNDKLEGNITLEMYKRIYNNLTLEISEINKKKSEYEKILFDYENNQFTNDNYYLDKSREFLKMKNPSRALVSLLIDKIEIDENKNVDIYYKFKLI